MHSQRDLNSNLKKEQKIESNPLAFVPKECMDWGIAVTMINF